VAFWEEAVYIGQNYRRI